MSNFWNLERRIVVEDGVAIEWPATAKLRVELQPNDLFGISSLIAPQTTITGETQVTFDGPTGKISILAKQPLDPAFFLGTYSNGEIRVEGNIVHLTALLTDWDCLENLLTWLSTALTQFLSVQVGVFVDVSTIDGTISGRSLRALYAAESYSLVLARVDNQTRDAAIRASLLGPAQNQSSYPRFAASASYFRHALRLLSPRQVNFPPYLAYAEVLLNLAKCVEILVSGSNRDDQRKEFDALGFTGDQVETIIMPIIIIRNQLDVAHPTSGYRTKEEIAVLRKFVDRAVKNVSQLLRRISQQIAIKDDFLKPLPGLPNDERSKLIKTLEGYLTKEELDPNSTTPIVFAAN